ncbi:unnamed protein product [Cylindrotheca closterium]|uniref:DUF6824 domain-containing protein n=1 Tax=Cylindrotheca closterium TaxID=2856 RepID=A0AAD2FIL3_9STRA|nr:unnamed protein product [Cylindrotheca closterium]
MTPEPQANPEKKVTVNGSHRSNELQEHDVVCEKGRGDHERWAGNRLYRFLINSHKETYNDLTPMERSAIIGNIIGTIKGKGGWFVQNDEGLGKLARLTEEKVRKKVSDDLRREVRRRREKRTSNTAFSSKLKALTKVEPRSEEKVDLKTPVDDPRAADVLFGPGARRHPGNKTYWDLMKQNLNQYIISPYGARSIISKSIVQGIRQLDGRFLEQDQKTSIWYEISDRRAIEKTSHALSNKKYKTRRRDTDDKDVSTPLKIDATVDSDVTSFSSNGSDAENAPLSTTSGSKKRRFLERMDDVPVDGDIATDRGVLLLTSLNAVGSKSVTSKKTPTGTPPATPPTKSKNLSMTVITPNHDSRAAASVSSVSDESSYGESQRPAKTMPPPVVNAPHIQEFSYPRPGAEMGPRVAPRYGRYMEEEYYNHEHMIHKLPPSPYPRRVEEYSSLYHRYPHGQPPPSPAGYRFPPKGQRPPYSLPMTPSRIPHHPQYWASEYASPPPARRGDEQKAWH